METHFLSYMSYLGRVTSMTLDVSPWQGPWGGENKTHTAPFPSA